MVLNFLYVPLVLRYLGVELYGLWAIILSVLNWITLFDIGIGNGLRNKLSAAIARGESNKEIRSLISSAYFLLASVVVVLGAFILLGSFLVDWNKFLSIDRTLYPDVATPIRVSFILVCTSFILSICKSLFFAVQRAHLVSLLGLLQQLLMLISVGILLWLPPAADKVLLVALAYGISALTVELAFTVVFFSRNRTYIPSTKYVTKAKALDVTSLGAQFFLVQIASLVLSSTDNVITANLFGPAAVTPFTTANKLFMALAGLFVAMISPYWSSVTANYEIYGSHAISKAIGGMLKLYAVATIGSLILFMFYNEITSIWLGQSLNNPQGLIFGTLIYSLLYMFNAIFSQIANGLSCLRMMLVVAVLQGVLNIPLSYFFASQMGSSTGVLVGTIIVMVISALIYPLYIYRRFFRGQDRKVDR